MTTISQEIKVDVLEVDGKKDWEHFYIIQDGDVKKVYLQFTAKSHQVKGDMSTMYPPNYDPAEYETEAYIEYDTVHLCFKDEDGEEDCEEYELTHEEEEAVIAYIKENYDC
jgi:hypothetical protein